MILLCVLRSLPSPQLQGEYEKLLPHSRKSMANRRKCEEMERKLESLQKEINHTRTRLRELDSLQIH